MDRKGFTNIEIFLIVAVFSTVYLIGMFNFSYAFETDYLSDAYDQRISLIEMQSELYASLNEDLFLDSSVIYIYVEDLIESNLISVNSDGDVIDPTNENNTLNNLKIKVELNDGEYVASVVEI